MNNAPEPPPLFPPWMWATILTTFALVAVLLRVAFADLGPPPIHHRPSGPLPVGVVVVPPTNP